jgi:hypothetical protein
MKKSGDLNRIGPNWADVGAALASLDFTFFGLGYPQQRS